MKEIAILLSGAGWKDGTNPYEVAFIIRTLEETNKAKPIPCAPDIEYSLLIDYPTDAVSSETRNVLTESNRLLVGEVKPISGIEPSEVDGLIIPGGNGVIWNLSDFAEKGINTGIHEGVKRLVQGVYLRGKPIGVLGYGGIILVFSLQKVASPILTIGKDTAAAGELEKAGALIIKASSDEIVFDDDNNLFSAHGISIDSSVSKAALGIEQLVNQVVNFKKQKNKKEGS
ncbi:hypothetical protein JXI42_11665 [bacterium]|nr:hypothetical protein [bacterium]